MNSHYRRSRQRSRYRLLGLVGNGQFGRVYCGVHRQTGQLVAIKYLQRHGLPTSIFLRELHCLWSLSHPNIVACYGLEHDHDGRRLVLEYCPGGTLRSRMLTPLTLGEILQLVTDILSGLAHAHQQGIVHCDIKPENILLCYRDRWQAKISDFGIAKLVQEQTHSQGTGQTGSPAYMAPERFYRQYSPAADVYGVGVLLFELLMGQRPFRGTPSDLRTAHLNQAVPELPSPLAPLQPLIVKALEKLPARRHPTALDMLADLKALLPSLDLTLRLPLDISSVTYAAGVCPVCQRLARPVIQICQRPPDPDQLGSPAPWLMAHGAQLVVLPSVLSSMEAPPAPPANRLPADKLPVVKQVLDSPIQGIYPTQTGLMVATQQVLWQGPWGSQLTPLVQWPAPALATVVAPHHRWVAATVAQQLMLVNLRPQPSERLIRRPLSPSLQVQQILTVDHHHLALVGNQLDLEAKGTELQLWNRRGLYLMSFNLGITLHRLTPLGPPHQQPHQWMALDHHAPQTVIFLSLKPLRTHRLTLDICPQLMVELPWGYLFSDAERKLLLLDRDFNTIGGIQGPSGITAIAPISTHELLIATWQGTGILHYLNLQDCDLDMIF